MTPKILTMLLNVACSVFGSVQETVQTSSINILALRLYNDPDYLDFSTMADMMWGGVPFTIPSITAMKYISGAVKVQVNS